MSSSLPVFCTSMTQLLNIDDSVSRDLCVSRCTVERCRAAHAWDRRRTTSSTTSVVQAPPCKRELSSSLLAERSLLPIQDKAAIDVGCLRPSPMLVHRTP